jgi:hypothetical protein
MSTTFDSKSWTLGWLSQAGEYAFVQVGAQCLANTNRGGTFTFA